MALGGGLFLAYRGKNNKLAAIESTETVTVEHLRTLADSMAEPFGQGALRMPVEIRGKVTAEQPLLAELSEEPCVYYAMSVAREYEETYIETDSQGRQRQGTRRGSETVNSNKRSISFALEDATGRLIINPKGAEIVAEQALSNFEPAADSGGMIRHGRFSLRVPRFGPGRRTLGYRFHEEIIPLGREVYVLGEATDQGGELRVGSPQGKEGRFIVSLKGEAQLRRELEKSTRWLWLAALGCGTLGFLLFLGGLL